MCFLNRHKKCIVFICAACVSTVVRTQDVGLRQVVPTQFRFNVGPASQPMAGSMLTNRLRHWPHTTPTVCLLYT